MGVLIATYLRISHLIVGVEAEEGHRQCCPWSMDVPPAKRATGRTRARQPPHHAPLVEPVSAL